MKFISIFSHMDYRQFIIARLNAGRQTRGGQAQLARHLKCQPSHISQMLSGTSNLAVEQALPIAAFFGLSRAEGIYFIDLIHYDRAGSAELKAHYKRLLKEQQHVHHELRERLKVTQAINDSHQSRFYSSWLYAAVHVMTSVPCWQTPAALSAQLGVSHSRVQNCLDFLVEIGLVRHNSAGCYEISNKHIHLGRESSLLANHHNNWRLRAIESLDEPNDDDLHYSSVVSLSKADVPRLRELLLQTMTEQQKLIADSKEETAFCVTVDLFSL